VNPSQQNAYRTPNESTVKPKSPQKANKKDTNIKRGTTNDTNMEHANHSYKNNKSTTLETPPRITT
jgi:hypothetical protein